MITKAFLGSIEVPQIDSKVIRRYEGLVISIQRKRTDRKFMSRKVDLSTRRRIDPIREFN